MKGRKKIYVYEHFERGVWWAKDVEAPTFKRHLRPDGRWWDSGTVGSIEESKKDGTFKQKFFNSRRWAIAAAKKLIKGCEIVEKRPY